MELEEEKLVKETNTAYLKFALLIFFFISGLVAGILAIIGFFKFGYNIIDYISGETVSRATLVSNFLMFTISYICKKVSFAITRVICQNIDIKMFG